MRDLLQELRRLLQTLPPGLDETAVAKLERALGLTLPSELAALYRDHDGEPGEANLPMHLLSAAEVLQTNASVRDLWPGLLTDGALLFWTDDNSNYAGVFLSAPLSPRVFLLDHEEPDDSPRFFNPRSFVAALLTQRDRAWVDLDCDYPATVEPTHPTAESDRALGERLLEAHVRNPDDTRSAFLALALLPPSNTALLMPLLASSDMWVQERTCEVLGLRRYAPAIHELTDVARRGRHNGRVASIRALQRIGTNEARQSLKRLRAELGDQYRPYFRS